ncbi:family 20 glycosylhydrolase [Actinomadura namibiensis]|uniref:beta-N-acetylhexosaminidase n=1 Tax=Actinomadura namibiensis TaxID=182080 RepID=A0A7W3LXE2_ACTNM|nr:family 20 glycosylhydrolase [Actinomadura namibiensis]MBA8956086.1 hexosaminidase [Actinomadura namibiensis]
MKESTPLVPLPQSVETFDGDGLRLGTRPRVAVSGDAPRGLGETVVELLARLHDVEPVLTGGDADLRLVLADRVPVSGIADVRGVDPLDGEPGEAGVRERYELVVTGDGATVTARAAEGLFRGATTFAQALRPGDGGPAAPAMRVADGPALAWRGLSLDVVRRFFTVAEVKRVVDLLALYKFNVLHLHLSDSQAWRLELPGWPRLTDPARWPGGPLAEDGVRPYYTEEDFREIVAYAADRFVTVVPELDMPGHVLAAVRAYPELQGEAEPAHELLAYLDPRSEKAARFAADALARLAELTPGRYLHLGGDEAFGMPDELYAAFVARALEIVRGTGRKVVGWQETARSGALTPDDVVQAWIGSGDEFDLDAARETTPPEYHGLLETVAETFARSAHDVPAAVAAGVPVLASASSFLYLDRRHAEESLDADQNARRTRVGFGDYQPRTCRGLFGWTPDTLVEIPGEARLAGVEAAVWCETVTGFEDLAFLLLPRLPGVAEKAWTPGGTAWDDYRGRVAGHRGWWERLGWGGYFRSAELFSR